MKASRNPRLDGARVGLIIPSVNTTIEPEFGWLGLAGMSFHVSRMMLRDTTPEGLRAMNADVNGAARQIASITPDVVAYACTSGSFVDGLEGLRRQAEGIASVVGCPVVATSAALLDALRQLDVARLALATPYLDSINRIERDFLEHNGHTVVSVVGLGLSGKAIREVKPETVFDLACRADRPEAQALFISCTDLRALEVVGELERQLRKPVVTSNQVTLWAVLRALSIKRSLHGFGKLLS